MRRGIMKQEAFPEEKRSREMDSQDIFEYEYGSMVNLSSEVLERCSLEELRDSKSTLDQGCSNTVSTLSFNDLPPFSVSLDSGDVRDEYGSMVSFIGPNDAADLKGSYHT
jgi:hypothetical protein